VNCIISVFVLSQCYSTRENVVPLPTKYCMLPECTFIVKSTGPVSKERAYCIHHLIVSKYYAASCKNKGGDYRSRFTYMNTTVKFLIHDTKLHVHCTVTECASVYHNRKHTISVYIFKLQTLLCYKNNSVFSSDYCKLQNVFMHRIFL